jgi:hypothetical protein
MFNFIRSWLGLNPKLPFYWEINNPMHGEVAKNSRHQKVIYDEKQGGKWVMPQNFSDKEPVTIK